MRRNVGEDHSPEELADQIKVAQYENDQMNDAIAHCSAWLASDPKSFGDYSGRVHAHSMLLPPLIAAAQEAIRRTPGMGPMARNVLSTPRYTALIAWRSELTALYREWLADPHGCTLPTFSATPQPTAPDPGLDVLKATQPVVDAVKKTGTIVLPILGAVPTVAVLAVAYLVLREWKR